MTQGMTFVLEDAGMLSDISGENDCNIKEIEKLLGHRVFVRGNEMILESESEDVRFRFKSIIDALAASAGEGRAVTTDFVRAVHESLAPDSGPAYPDSFREAFIQITPGSARIFPKSFNQAAYVANLMTHDITFAVGPAGTGKTYLAVAHALSEVLQKKKRKLVLTRPIVEAGESLGFLPGDLVQKINPYLRPLYDAMEALLPYEAMKKLEESRAMEIAPLAYMRGRSLSNSVVILDEGQNTTIEQMKMFLTRLGEGSKVIVTGDITQVDLPKRCQSGLVHALGILADIPEISINRFDGRDVVRHPLIKKIIRAYEEGEGR